MKNIFVLLLMAVLCLSGCFWGNRPDDMPKLYPCRIAIEMDGKALSQATVRVIPPSGSYVAFGQTDSEGWVILKTLGKYDGVPAGSYKVLVSKSENTNSNWDPDDGRTGKPDIKEYVDPSFRDANTTPLECSIQKGKNEFRFEVHAPR